MVRQAVDLRGVAADPAARPLARRYEAREHERRPGERDRLRRDVPAGGRGGASERRARTQPGARPQGPDAGRLAEELLLPLLRVPRPPQRPPALRGGDRPLQAGSLLRAGHGLLGAVRPPDRPERADERLRKADLREHAEGTGGRAGPPAQRVECAGPGPGGDSHPAEREEAGPEEVTFTWPASR